MSSRGAAGVVRTAEHARPDHFLLHLSDTHLLVPGGHLYDAIAPERTLQRLFDDLEASGARPEAIVFTGDLADHGDEEAYRLLRSIVEPAARRLGAQVIWCMGNHDDRGTFRRVLFGQARNSRPVDQVHDVNGLRVITLDTSVPGQHWGALSGAQLDWLAEELASPAPHGTILALHHPPLPCIQDLAVLVELREQQELREVLEGSDVRAILAGHVHFSTSGTFAGIPVSVASATCYTQDLTGQPRGTRPQDGNQSYNLVHVFDDTVLHSVVPVAAGITMSSTSAEQSAAILEAEGVVVPERINPPVRRVPDRVDAELQLLTSPITLPARD